MRQFRYRNRLVKPQKGVVIKIVSIIIAIIVFGIIIMVHEFGHFIAAKKSGVRVNEFAIGMGPKLFSKQHGETKYSLRLLPIGGYCSMECEDSSSEDERAFCKKSVAKRIIIVVAGALMNLILGFIFIVVMTSMSDTYASTTVSWFEDNASSQASGLQVGDKVTSINGMHIFTDTDFAYQLQSDKDGVFDMIVIRDGEKKELENVEFSMTESENKDGEKSSSLHIDFKVEPIERSFTSVVSQSWRRSVSYARLIWVSLGDLITGQYKINDLSGPVGIVSAISDVVSNETTESGINWSELFQNLFSMAALISINVGIFNLLPLPALDGGRLIFLIIEAIRRKPISPEKEGVVHFAGLALLMLLMLYVTFNDIVKLIG